MNPELIETPTEALIFIVIELIMLTVTLAHLTYLFLKDYPIITKIKSSNNYNESGTK